MREPSAKRILAKSLQVGLLGWAVSLATLPTLTWAAETVPASVRACTAEVDLARRLVCFDREVARYPDPKVTSQAPAKSPATPSTTGSSSANIAAAAASTPAPATAASAASTSAPESTKPGRISARVVSIDRSPNEMVLHLDNGQSWQQQQAMTGDLSLKAGDDVTINKSLGSYYLTGPHLSGMKVRQTN